VTTTAPAAPPGSGAGSIAPAPRAALTHRQIQVVMSGLMLGVLLAALDQTIVSTALQTITNDFHRPDLYSWVVTSYLLTSTASTPLYGKISDLFGRKTIFQFAIVLFLVGSVLCGVAQSMVQLILFRGVQGLGAGGLISLALAIVGDVISPRERGRYQGYFGAVFGASSVLGPLIGGTLVDGPGWRWVFYVNVPIGIIALVVTNRVLALDYLRRKARIDVLGAALLVGGVSLFLVAVQNSGREARISGGDFVLGAIGLLLVAAFVAWETRASEPVLPLRLFRDPVFRVSSVLSVITGAVMFGAIIFLPRYFQGVRGVSATVSGLRLLPLLAGLLLTSIGSGRLISRIGRYKAFVVAGTAILAVGLGLLTSLTVTTGALLLSVDMFVVGLGLGLFMQTLVLATQNSVGMRDLGVATSAVTFFRTLGGAVGASVLGAVQTSTQRSHLVEYVGPQAAATAARDPKGFGTALLGAPHALPAPVRLPAQQLFTYGITRAFLVAVPVAVVGFFVSLLLREVPLRGTAGVTTAGPQGGVPKRTVGQDAAVAAVGSDAAAGEAPGLAGPAGRT